MQGGSGIMQFTKNKKLAVYIYFTDAFPTRLSGGRYTTRASGEKANFPPLVPTRTSVGLKGGNILKNVQRANL
jgi:hypothetical protein